MWTDFTGKEPNRECMLMCFQISSINLFFLSCRNEHFLIMRGFEGTSDLKGVHFLLVFIRVDDSKHIHRRTNNCAKDSGNINNIYF